MTIAIDALSALLIIELSVLLLGTTLFFWLRARRYKNLYRRALDPAAERPSETPEDIENVEEMSDTDGSPDVITDPQYPADFQKRLMQDFKGFKDLFGDGRKQLSVIYKFYQGIQDDIEQGKALDGDAFGQTNRKLESYIKTLEADNETLSLKFRLWEEELKKFEGLPGATSGAPAGGAGHDADLREKNELMARLDKAEAALKEKDRLLAEQKTKFENLEQEYLILYKRDQEQRGLA